jgi:hypothetical protein
MGGGLMQLVAYGAQDIYLTGNPQITFFKVVYRRHTNFSMEAIEQTFNGSVGFGNRVTATVSRNGDLVHRMWLQADVKITNAANAANPYPENVGHQLVKEAELEVGGQRVDKQYADWMEMWSQLTVSSEHSAGYNTMVGDALVSSQAGLTSTLYVPLQFWFCRNPGLALPLIALQYHEVKINLTFGSLIAKTNNTVITPSLSSASLWVDYIYLDTDERRRFAQVSHEYLIEQVQHTGDEAMTASTTNNVRLNFNHPVKELVWAQIDSAEATTHTNFRFGAYEALSGNTKLQLNGHDRMAERPAAYFNQVQPYQHHTNIPSGYVYVYSFALKPEEHQPSGTCNFSRIDNATLSVTTAAHASVLKVFAVNYNVLRVMSGMGGLAYSN